MGWPGRLVRGIEMRNNELSNCWRGEMTYLVSLLCASAWTGRAFTPSCPGTIGDAFHREAYAITEIRSPFRAILMVNKSRSMVARLVSSRCVANMLAGLHRHIDQFETRGERGQWRKQWESGQATMLQLLFCAESESD